MNKKKELKRDGFLKIQTENKEKERVNNYEVGRIKF